jgi:uncharacterized sulfatase
MAAKTTGLFGFAALAAQALAATPPNIVMILIDDVGTGWIPPYADRLTPDDLEPEILNFHAQKRNNGTPIDTEKHLQAARSCMPYLAGLAKDGAVFDRCFATASLCAPSRAGLLTGTFQQRWGAYWNMDVDNYGVPTNRVVLAEPLSAAGYRCGMIGKWHIATKDPAILQKVWSDQGGAGEIPANKLAEITKTAKENHAYQSSSLPGQHPLDRGFDYYFGYNSHDSKYYRSKDLWENHSRVPQRPEGELLTDLFNDKACGFIDSALKEKKPVFLYYAPMTLHGAIHPPPEHYSEKFDTGVKFSNEYAGHLLALDDGIRKIFQTLEKYGQATNTLFLFSADNGGTVYAVPPHNAPYRGGKGTGWLGGMHVPFIVYQAGVVKPGIHNDIVSLADVMPTILEEAGSEIPPGIDGKSLLPLLRGETAKGPRDSLVSCGIHSSHWSYFYEGGGDINLRDGPVSPMYVWALKGDSLLLQITPLKPGIMASLPDGLPARTLLYDLSADRQQRKDLHGLYPEKTETLKREIQRWLHEMPEPLSSQQEDYRMLRDSAPEGALRRIF